MNFGIRVYFGKNSSEDISLFFPEEPTLAQLGSLVRASVVTLDQSAVVWSLESVNSSEEQARSYLSRN